MTIAWLQIFANHQTKKNNLKKPFRMFSRCKRVKTAVYIWCNSSALPCLLATSLKRLTAQVWWLLFVRARSLLVVRSIDYCSCPEPSCLSVERLSFIEAWVNTALWPKCSCCLVFSYVLCIIWTGCFCRTTIVMTISWSPVCWNSVL